MSNTAYVKLVYMNDDKSDSPIAVKAANEKVGIVAFARAIENGKWLCEYDLPDGTKITKQRDHSGVAIHDISRYAAFYEDYLKQQEKVEALETKLATEKATFEEDRNRVFWFANKQ